MVELFYHRKIKEGEKNEKETIISPSGICLTGVKCWAIGAKI